MIPTVTVLTASGTYNTPANCKYIKAYIIGGGGGGAGSDTNDGGSGGGAGGVNMQFFDPGSYSVTIGTGGAGGTGGASATNGSTGTDTTFGGVIATRGSGGLVGSDTQSIGGRPVTTARNQFCAAGYTGGPYRAAGNGGANLFSINGLGAYVISGAGENGGQGTGFGAGGGGGSSTAASGGLGTNGAVIIEEYY